MSTLYLFGIGGSGARVLKQFTVMLASGVELKGIDVIKPVLIDEDNGDAEKNVGMNGSVADTIEFLQEYKKIHESWGEENSINYNKFFGRKIENISTIENFKLVFKGKNLENETGKVFKEFIKAVRDEDKDLLHLLYSNENLDTLMKGGFFGQPNIGSVVYDRLFDEGMINSLIPSPNDIGENDRIVFIGSIFGGTGAAGLPVLVRKIRKRLGINDKAIIGAVSLLPYFNVKQGSKIDSNKFNSKTLAALEYYKNIFCDKLNVIHYVGDYLKPTYDYHDSGSEQNYESNPANFVEFIAATAVVDFVNTNKAVFDNQVVEEEQTDTNGNTIKVKKLKGGLPKVFTYEVQADGDQIKFSSVAEDDNNENLFFKNIISKMAAFHLFSCFMENSWDKKKELSDMWTDNPWAYNDEEKTDRDSFAKNVYDFSSGYHKMLKQMLSLPEKKHGGRALNVFYDELLVNVTDENDKRTLLTIINDMKPDMKNKSFFEFARLLRNYARDFDDKKTVGYNLLTLFSQVCEKIVTDTHKKLGGNHD